MDSSFFLDLILILLAAIAGGFCSSAPLGAINLWITDAVLEHRERRLTWFIVGVICMDCVHASFAAWGYHAFFSEGPVARWLTIAGGAFLVVLGSLGILKRAQARGQAPATAGLAARRPLNDFLLGAFMCGANPAFLMFWIFVVNLVEDHANVDISEWRLVPFLIGIAIGDGLWFGLLLQLARRGRDAFKPRVLASVRATIAAAFVLVGSIAIYHGIKPH